MAYLNRSALLERMSSVYALSGAVTIISVLYGLRSLMKPQAATMINDPPLAILTVPLEAGAHNRPSK